MSSLRTVSGLSEREQKLWDKIGHQVPERGRPDAVAPGLTPWPVWALLVSMIIFLPGVILLSFWVKRHVVARFGGELVVFDVSFWRMRVAGVRLTAPIARPELKGASLVIGDERVHIEPGWGQELRRLVAANA